MTRIPPIPPTPQRLLLAYRIGLGLLFAGHGAQSMLTTALSGPARWVATAQFVAGTLVLLGVLSRPAALLCAAATGYGALFLTGAAAVWPATGGAESAVVFGWGMLLIAVCGPGPWRPGRLAVARAQSNPAQSNPAQSNPAQPPETEIPAA